MHKFIQDFMTLNHFQGHWTDIIIINFITHFSIFSVVFNIHSVCVWIVFFLLLLFLKEKVSFKV